MEHSKPLVLLLSMWSVVGIFAIVSIDTYLVIFYGLFLTFLVLVLPIAILNFSYYVHDRHTKLSRSGNTFRYTTNKIDFEFTRDDILEIIMYKQHLTGIHATGFQPWKNYFYIEIVLKNQRELILSSMLFDHSGDLQLPLKMQHKAYPLLPMR